MQPQAMRLPPGQLDYVKIEERPYGPLGPDLAFLKLRDETAEALGTHCSFLNLPKEAQLSKAPPPNDVKETDIVFGLVGKWDDDDPSGVLDKGVITALANLGTIDALPSHAGFDRLQFTPGNSPEIQLPRSYGGTSGGGLWRLYTEKLANGEDHRVQARLLGIPYYEIYLPDRSPNIICHGPNSIYKFLMNDVCSRWPKETAAE